ncbi:unnamed protein product [Lupinus luteus]|uniref:Uncharacterized protein n=1 Tax=Lupinus luteus TaxID=3873 RepID=A0AAV1YF60_LUPLU
MYLNYMFLLLSYGCQRSSQCPMCWQAFNLKDPTRTCRFQCVICIYRWLTIVGLRVIWMYLWLKLQVLNKVEGENMDYSNKTTIFNNKSRMRAFIQFVTDHKQQPQVFQEAPILPDLPMP